ncbi:esterase-like activity of phytase family protein [Nocardia salmonicida]|uniref:esterase-like activity of phytase family protein n=1 Tax=Nocardia salmonicida TaxID=53431 RepID=UPI00366C55F6
MAGVRRLSRLGVALPVEHHARLGTDDPASCPRSVSRARSIADRIRRSPTGLSGIDYLFGSGEFVSISHDRSEKGPARIYTARIPLGEAGIGPVSFVGTKPLLRPDAASAFG